MDLVKFIFEKGTVIIAQLKLGVSIEPHKPPTNTNISFLKNLSELFSDKLSVQDSNCEIVKICYLERVKPHFKLQIIYTV